MKEAPGADSSRELRLVLREAVTLTDIEKQGIKGGGGVREVPVKVYGDLVLLIPVRDGKADYATSSGELNYLGVNRIGFRGPLREDPANPLKIENGTVHGSVLFPVSIKEPKQTHPRVFDLSIALDLAIKTEKFGYTPDPDASIPPWRADKTKPSGFKVTGTWRTVESRPDLRVELEGKIAGTRGCYRMSPTPGYFFPTQSVDLAPAPGGMAVTAHASTARVDGHDGQWAVKELPAPVDLRRFNGLRLRVRSDVPASGKPIPAGVAVAFRIKGQPWFACRTVAPLLGGGRDHVVDFGLFARGTANPGYKGGPNMLEFPDLSQVDAVAVGVANPFGVGDVSFVVESLEAVRHAERGAGEAPSETVTVTVDPQVKESLAGADSVPGRLFGYHLANPTFRSNDTAPAWFDAPPVSGDGLRLLELARPESLRPIDHTNFTAETGASMVHPLETKFADAAGDRAGTMHTITNENLWARPKWMDTDPDLHAEGIKEMFRQIGTMAWTPDKPENTLRRIEFWNEPFMWARHINRGQSTLSAGPGDPGGNRGRKPWTDPTQYTFMPGKLGGEMYAKFFNAAADGLAETNPHVEIGGMSSGLFGEDFFSQLTNYVSHFLAASHEKLDFLTEHHYSSHAPSTAAAYEVTTAWTLAKHGKRWPIWNTEANDLDDVAPGDKRSAEAAKAFTDINRAYYNYRDILELILKSRDKAAGRAIHALWGRGWFRNEGEHLMYVHTADLRGTVVLCASDDPAIIPVAVWENGRLAIYLLNDSPFPRTTSLQIARVGKADGITASGLRLAPDGSTTGIFPSAFKATPHGDGMRLTFLEPLSAREIVKILIPNVPAPTQTRETAQHFSDILVTDILPGKDATGTVTANPATIARAKSATLRLIARDTQTGEAKIRIGEVEVDIPALTAEGGHHVITDIPLPSVPGFKDSKLPVTATSAAGTDGWALYGLSLLTSDR
ncbi:MAG: hypothetical protein Fur0032_06020 [Terrimicrobiaceae bacterium]